MLSNFNYFVARIIDLSKRLDDEQSFVKDSWPSHPPVHDWLTGKVTWCPDAGKQTRDELIYTVLADAMVSNALSLCTQVKLGVGDNDEEQYFEKWLSSHQVYYFNYYYLIIIFIFF